MGVKQDEHLLGGTAIKPPGWDRKGFEAFQYMLYNPETGEVLTRTPLSWLKIFVFYVIYYGLLTCFWIASLQIFFVTLPEIEEGPRWKQDWGIIGKNPGLGIRPGPTDVRIDSHMYFINSTDKDWEPTDDDGEGDKNVDYAVRMQKYMESNYNSTAGLTDCDDENRVRGHGELGCKFDLSELGDCQEFPYGFVQDPDDPDDSGISPCFFFKLNKIFEWEPTPVDPANLDAIDNSTRLPIYKDMPETLKKHIKNQESNDPNMIWVDCQGIHAADKEKLDITYFPDHQGIPVKFFPYRGGNYQPPLVAIKFNRPERTTTEGQLIHVECRAWFDKVQHSRRDKMGLMKFEVYFDERFAKVSE